MALLADEFTARLSVRIAIVYYGIAVLVMPWLGVRGWQARSWPGRFIRLVWSLGWLAYGVHVILAFHVFHAWSHEIAMQHVRERSGFGEGIFFSHAFTLLWAFDVLSWWAAPERHARRPAWIGRVLHAYLAFIVFNATVVYERGLIRAGGIVLFSLLALDLVWRKVSE